MRWRLNTVTKKDLAPQHQSLTLTFMSMDQISIKIPNAKCRLYWCSLEFIDRRYSQQGWYFRPLLWTSAPLTLFGTWLGQERITWGNPQKWCSDPLPYLNGHYRWRTPYATRRKLRYEANQVWMNTIFISQGPHHRVFSGRNLKG